MENQSVPLKSLHLQKKPYKEFYASKLQKQFEINMVMFALKKKSLLNANTIKDAAIFDSCLTTSQTLVFPEFFRGLKKNLRIDYSSSDVALRLSSFLWILRNTHAASRNGN